MTLPELPDTKKAPFNRRNLAPYQMFNPYEKAILDQQPGALAKARRGSAPHGGSTRRSRCQEDYGRSPLRTKSSLDS